MKRITLPKDLPSTLDPTAILIATLQPLVTTDPTGNQVLHGITLDDIADRLPIRAKILAAKRTFLLEDAEWQILCDCITTTRWTTVDEHIVTICRAVLDAPDDKTTKPK